MRTATACSGSIPQGGEAFAKSRKARFAERLTNRPRKCLDYQTPVEVFNLALAGAHAICIY